LPLPQGAIIKLNASETKLDASSTSYRYRLFFIMRICPPVSITLGGFVLCYIYYTINLGVKQILIAKEKPSLPNSSFSKVLTSFLFVYYSLDFLH